jgi:hypothetical protein
MRRVREIPSTWGCRDDWQRAIRLIGRGVSQHPPLMECLIHPHDIQPNERDYHDQHAKQQYVEHKSHGRFS